MGKPKPALLLGMTIVACLLPFVILAFLNCMASDDYLQYNAYKARGFFPAQQYVYLLWAGRYTSTFLCGLFVTTDLVHRYYFCHTLILFLSTWGAVFFLLTRLHTLLPERPFTRGRIFLASAAFFFLLLYVQAEIATGFYWFSSALVYQTAFIFFLVFAGLLVKRWAFPGAIQKRDWLPVLSIVLLIGCNEISAVFFLFFLMALIAACYYYGQPVPKFLFLYLGITAVIGGLLMLTSGVLLHRHKLMLSNTGAAGILSAIAFQTVATFYYIFKEPLFWLSAAAAFALGIHLSDKVAFAAVKEKNGFVPGFLGLLLMLILTLAAVLIATSGSLPARALNNMTDLVTCCLLVLFFIAGVKKGSEGAHFSTVRLTPIARTAIVIAVLIANVNYLEAWKTVFSGYVYHAIMTDRDRQLSFAAEQHRKTDTILPYEEARQEKITQVFPRGVFVSVRNLLVEKPSLLYFYNGAEAQDTVYLNFYGLDSVTMRKK